MSINQSISKENNQVTIAIKNNFDFSLHQHFRDAYAGCDQARTTFILDLSGTDYMDSSALGMILLLKDHADSVEGEVIIKKPSETVYKILEIAQFHRLVTIKR
jgi:HptB-dependent secretion and biofilm anti anti-sigma factor